MYKIQSVLQPYSDLFGVLQQNNSDLVVLLTGQVGGFEAA